MLIPHDTLLGMNREARQEHPEMRSDLYWVTRWGGVGGRTSSSFNGESVRNHALRLLHEAVAGPLLVRLQPPLDRLPLFNGFPLPPHQVRVGREVRKRSTENKMKVYAHGSLRWWVARVLMEEAIRIGDLTYPLKSSIEEKLCILMKSFSSSRSFLTRPYPCIITPVHTWGRCSSNVCDLERLFKRKIINTYTPIFWVRIVLCCW